MAKKENTIPTIIDTPEALTAKIAAMKEAQKIFATFTQEQVDKIFKAAATAADKARIPLAIRNSFLFLHGLRKFLLFHKAYLVR